MKALTYVSSEKELALVIRYYSHKKSAFVTAFLGLGPVFDCSASGLFTNLKEFLDKCHLPITDSVGVGTNGASMMCGQHDSLYSRMKEVDPNLVLNVSATPCSLHSMRLWTYCLHRSATSCGKHLTGSPIPQKGNSSIRAFMRFSEFGNA